MEEDIKNDIYYFLNLYRNILLRKSVDCSIEENHEITDKLYRIRKIFDYLN